MIIMPVGYWRNVGRNDPDRRNNRIILEFWYDKTTAGSFTPSVAMESELAKVFGSIDPNGKAVKISVGIMGVSTALFNAGPYGKIKESANTWRFKLTILQQSPGAGLLQKDPLATIGPNFEVVLFWTLIQQQKLDINPKAVADIIAHEAGYHHLAEDTGSVPIAGGGHLHDATGGGRPADFVDAKGFNRWGNGVFSKEASERIRERFGK